jgi:hypothetical protein
MRDLGGLELVLRKPNPMQQHDRDAVDPGCARVREVALQLRRVERLEYSAVRVDALRRADDARIQHFRQADVEREDLGPLLAADPNGVLEPGRDDEHRRLAPPFQQRVRRDGRAHLDGRDPPLAFGRRGQQPPDAGDCRVLVPAGVVRQQLQRL